MPAAVVQQLADHVEVCDGRIVDQWPVTEAIAAIVQPLVGETIDVASGAWFVSCYQVQTGT